MQVKSIAEWGGPEFATFVIKIFVLLILVAILHRFYCNSLHIAAHMIYYLGLDAKKPDIVV